MITQLINNVFIYGSNLTNARWRCHFRGEVILARFTSPILGNELEFSRPPKFLAANVADKVCRSVNSLDECSVASGQIHNY